MRIGVDYRMVANHKGGMSIYIKSLIENLKKIDKKNQYFVFIDQTVKKWGGIYWLIKEQYWLQSKLKDVFKAKGIELGFFPNPPVPLLISSPIILNIPDVSFVFDTSMSWVIKFYLFITYFISAHKANKISTFSDNSKKDIIKIFRVNPNKIFVTPLASPNEIRIQSAKGIAIDLYKFDINNPYILAFPGTFIPRKNMADLLLSFSEVCKQIKWPIRLVVVGIKEQGNYKEIVQLSNKLGIYNKISYISRPSYSQLSSLYCGASVFVCTSLYEGFGLPILEAMKCGAPVISYSNSSLTELVGDAGVLVKDQTELTTAMLKVLKDKNLQKALKEKGLKRASVFSWKKTATIFLKNLNAV